MFVFQIYYFYSLNYLLISFFFTDQVLFFLFFFQFKSWNKNNRNSKFKKMNQGFKNNKILKFLIQNFQESQRYNPRISKNTQTDCKTQVQQATNTWYANFFLDEQCHYSNDEQYHYSNVELHCCSNMNSMLFLLLN